MATLIVPKKQLKPREQLYWYLSLKKKQLKISNMN